MASETLPPQSRILVTGANGFIASHIINLLLQRGYRVRGTVREPRPWLDQLFQKYDYESVILPDLAQPHASLFDDVAGVVLVATDNSFDPDPALIERVVQGTLAMLEAAKNSAVKSVVLTSSSAACITPTYASEPTVIDNATYNDAVVASVQAGNPQEIAPGHAVYAASKTEAERQAFKWVEENQPRFRFNTVVPDNVIGSRINPNVHDPVAPMKALLSGKDFFMRIYPPGWYVNVEDTARLHIAALLDPKIQSERIFGTAAKFTWPEVIAILRKLRPNSNTPDAPNDHQCQLDYVLSNRAEQILLDFFGSGWVSLEVSLEQAILDVE
ncbi:cinnamoyl-CoA reductase [Penicillium brevicompactum]|uniref:cinnamoyl-CoA reductase n=1 Tax=Penicillium brevicompactum TaxID=5074 RepID=UPI002541A6B8|nr:cinnamoyl-CoA reductase [Penicillium brevicompactum]KAJ5321955.1 cinnamoyl-CoA reductase [Penicillium brevicompactum]